MRPEQFYQIPIMGIIETAELKMEIIHEDGRHEEKKIPPAIYEVLAENDVFYVTNVWDDENKKKPLIVSKDIVTSFESLKKINS